MTLDEVLKYYENAYRMQMITNIARTNVNHWRKIGYIPITAQFRIEKLTNGQLKANIKDCDVNRE